MPPRKKKTQAQKMTETFTLEDALNFLNSLANADASKRNWKDSLITLTNYYINGSDTAFQISLSMTKAEVGEKYKDENIVPIIKDFDKVSNIIENEIKSKRTNENIAIDTKKQIYLAIVRVTQKGSAFQLDKEIRKKYENKVIEFDKLSNQARNKNEPKKGNLANPFFDWDTAQKEYDAYISSKAFTKTEKGKKDLRTAVLAGLYVLQRPRRVQDYALLQYFSKKPNEKESENRNIIYKEDDKLFFSIDVFKTRWRVSGQSKQKKELLPRYVKEVNSRLASLILDYIKKADIKDMSKLTTTEKRQNKNYYLFHLENTPDAGYSDNTFSKVVANAFKAVFDKRNGLTVNSMRHIFNTWIAENIQLFNDAKLQELAVDLGDSPRQMPTNLRYRIADQDAAELQKTEIEDVILQTNEYNKNMRYREEGASVGDIEANYDNLNQDDNEVQSPAPNNNNEKSLDELYRLLGKAVYEVETIKLLINKKLNNSM